MRRWLLLAALGGLLAPTSVGADVLEFGEFGFGAYGAMDVPLAQDDARPGPLFGARARMGLHPRLAAEFTATLVRDGDSETVSGGHLPAPAVNSFGLGLVTRGVNRRLNFAVSGGLGYTIVDFPGGSGSNSALSYTLGTALELAVGPVVVDLGPRLLVVGSGDGGTRKHLGILSGVSFYFD